MERGLYKNRSNLHIKTTAALVLIIVSMLTDHIQAAGVDVEPNTALLIEGQKTELLCRYGRPINYCRIEIPGEKVLNLSPLWSKTPGFSYYGTGLDNGQCGVTIDRVSASHNGKVKCSLGFEGEEYEGNIDLVVALRPHQPVIELLSKPDQDEAFAAESKFAARCIVRDGRPAANITWFVDDLPIYQGLNPPEVIESQSDKNVTLSTTAQLLQKYLTPEDDGKMLICRAHHQTDREQPQEGKFLLKVRYAPVPQPETTVYGLYLEHTAMVNITIRANPTPITEWTIEGIAIPQGTQSGRYSAYEPVQLGNGYYNVTLAIAGLTLQDTTKTYNLKASNAFGVREYSVRISSSATPPSSGLDVGSIVGIAVAVAILVIIVLLIGFARATGRWCFGGKKSRSPTSETHDDGTATQQPGPNVALLESNINSPNTPNGVTIVANNNNNNKNGTSNGNQNNMNGSGRQRNSSLMASTGAVNGAGNDDDSFEYATDRESGVYNATTVPLRNGRNSTTSRQSTASDENDQHQQGTDLLTRGNQLGIPESRCTRWIPKDQRELLERQAKLLANRIQKPVETEF
ncbi:fasciclin-3 isoform X2 [Episyrphus balteatus]|uniref:fasciclin-3 isoform X2 n=1 Tax=Episyrphus balteatus TaxID=286459 RepID=UPI002485D606|nr:fasciclin-3 isoform X2 [Episyrphus balteatus]